MDFMYVSCGFQLVVDFCWNVDCTENPETCQKGKRRKELRDYKRVILNVKCIVNFRFYYSWERRGETRIGRQLKFTDPDQLASWSHWHVSL